MVSSKVSLQRETLESTINRSLKIIRMYDWLLDMYVLDFFVENHWDKLPASWRESFIDMDPQILGDILSNKNVNKVLPLSFLALLKAVKTCSIPRKSEYQLKCNNNENLGTCGGHPKLKNLFLKHVKLKKRHEISCMSSVVSEVASESDCNAVIDFGSGLGHLVRVLAYKHGLYTAGIECQSQLTLEARKLDMELEYTVGKHIFDESLSKLNRPIHYNMTLSCDNQLSEIDLPDTMMKYGLVGLHPCGDLGPLLLRHFINCNKVKFICLVGCCYMKLSCNSNNVGYPMSRYVKGLANELSYVSREIACHALEVYTERLQKGNYEDLKIHAYRATLERILVGHDPKLKHMPIRSIKHSNTMTFEKYCKLALERVDMPLPSCPETWERGHSDLQQWRRVVTVYTLRLMLAPLVETVILYDRMLFVLENGLSCEIHPVFDAKLSPRNHIMIARR